VGLNVFQRQADKLFMCNIAQTVNVLQSVLLAYENNCVRTTSYYAFLMQKPHRSKTAVRVATEDTTPLAWSVSASRKDNELVLTFAASATARGCNWSCLPFRSRRSPCTSDAVVPGGG
jgi:alpha-N-arabinofuranosidase